MTEPLYDASQDPIAQTVLMTMLEPAWAEFATLRPDATQTEQQAFEALLYTYGMSLVLALRLAARLDTVIPEPSKLGGLLGNFTFTPDPERDTPGARLDVARKFMGVTEQPPVDDRPWPGLYI